MYLANYFLSQILIKRLSTYTNHEFKGLSNITVQTQNPNNTVQTQIRSAWYCTKTTLETRYSETVSVFYFIYISNVLMEMFFLLFQSSICVVWGPTDETTGRREQPPRLWGGFPCIPTREEVGVLSVYVCLQTSVCERKYELIMNIKNVQ